MPDAKNRKPKGNAKPSANAKGKQQTKKQAKKQAGSANEPTRRRGLVRSGLLAVVLVGLLFGFVYPTRTFLDQRRATSDAQTQLELLQAENAKLAKESKLLTSDAEIERLARERYGLVKPGEKAFVIVPAPTTPPATTTPASSGQASSSSSSSSPPTTSPPTTTANSAPSRRP